MAGALSAEEIDALWNFERPADSERAFSILLDRVGAETEAGAEVLTQIARTQGLRQQFEEAHRTLDGVEPFLGAHATRLRVRYLLERGRVLNTSGQAAAARGARRHLFDLHRRGVQAGRKTGEHPDGCGASSLAAYIRPAWGYAAGPAADDSR